MQASASGFHTQIYTIETKPIGTFCPPVQGDKLVGSAQAAGA